MRADWGGPLLCPFKYVPVTLINHIRKSYHQLAGQDFYFFNDSYFDVFHKVDVEEWQ